MKKTHSKKERNLIGRRVRIARLKATPAISQDDLSGKLAALGVTLDRTAISRIELQTRYVMDFEAAAISKCLKVPIEWLFSDP